MGESKLYSLLLWKLDLYPLGILITIENRHRYSDLIYCIWLWDLVDLENWVKIGLNLLIFPISRPCQDSYYPSNQHSFWILLKLDDQIVSTRLYHSFFWKNDTVHALFTYFSAVFIWQLEKLSTFMIKLTSFKNDFLVLSLS